MKTSIDYKKLLNKARAFIVKNRLALTIAVIVGVFGFALFRIDQLANPEVDQAKLDEAIAEYKRVKVDEDTIAEIRRLNESEVEVSPSFNNRDNPFVE